MNQFFWRRLAVAQGALFFSALLNSGCNEKVAFIQSAPQVEPTYVERSQDLTSAAEKPETSLILAYNTSPSAVANRSTLEAGIDSFLNAVKGFNVKVTAISLNKAYPANVTRYSTDPNCKVGLSTTPLSNPSYRCILRAPGTAGAVVVKSDNVDASGNNYAVFSESISNADFAIKKQALKKAVVDQIGIDAGSTAVMGANDNFCSVLAAANDPANGVLRGQPVAFALVSNQKTSDTLATNCYQYTRYARSNGAGSPNQLRISFSKVSSVTAPAYLRQDRVFSVSWQKLVTNPDGSISVSDYSNPAFLQTCMYDVGTTALSSPLATDLRFAYCKNKEAGYDALVAGVSNNLTYDQSGGSRNCSADELAAIAIQFNSPVVTHCTVAIQNKIKKQSTVSPTSGNDSRVIALSDSPGGAASCSTAFNENRGGHSVAWTSGQAYLDATKPGTDTWTCTGASLIAGNNGTTVEAAGENIPVVALPASEPVGARFGYMLNQLLSANNALYKASFIYVPTTPSGCANPLPAGTVSSPEYLSIVQRNNQLTPAAAASYNYCSPNYAPALGALAQFIQSITAYAIDWRPGEMLLKVEVLKAGTWIELSAGQQGTVSQVTLPTPGYKLYLNVNAAFLADVKSIRVTSQYPQ